MVKYKNFIIPLFLGCCIIIVFIPALQWLDRYSIMNPFETGVPNPFSFSVLFGLLFLCMGIKLLGRIKIFSAKFLFIIYIMCILSIPFGSFGLMRPFFWAVTNVAGEHVDRKINTVKKAYLAQNGKYYLKMEKEDYQKFLDLDLQKGGTDQDKILRKKKKLELILPLKRFWSGAFSTPEELNRSKTENWSILKKINASLSAIPLNIWVPVLARWGILFLLVFLIALYWGNLLNKEWAGKENLVFPLTLFPLSILSNDNSNPNRFSILVSNPFFLGGILFAVFSLGIGGSAHYNIVNIDFNTAVSIEKLDFSKIFINEPWTIINDNIFFISPLLIGIALFINQDILRGTLLVFVIFQFLRLALGMATEHSSSLFSFNELGFKGSNYADLGLGAGIIFGILYIYRTIVKAPSNGDRKKEFNTKTYLIVTTVFMFILGFWLLDLGIEGISGVFVFAFFFFWLFIGAVVLARLRAEGGLPTNSIHFSDHFLGLRTGGIMVHGFSNSVIMSHASLITISCLPGLLATHLENWFIAKKLNISKKEVIIASTTAFLLSIIVGYTSFMVFSYWYGFQNMSPLQYEWYVKHPLWQIFQRGSESFVNIEIDYGRIIMIVIGAIIMGAFIIIRKKFPRFSINPICFLLVCLGTFLKIDTSGVPLWASPEYINFIWGPFLIALIYKNIIIKYGGMDIYERTLPLGYGLVFGHLFMILFWNCYHGFIGGADLQIYTGIYNYYQ